MKRLAWFATMLMVVFAGLAAAEEPRPLRVGAVFPFTGKQARQGQLGRAGIELALDELKGSFTPKVIYEDSQSETKEAVNAFTKLKAADGVDVVLTMGSPAAMALLPLANRSGVVLLAMVVVPGFSAADDYGFRLMGSVQSFGSRMKALLVDELKKERVALIYVEDDYGSGYAKFLGEELRQAGVLAGMESYLPGTTDFRPLLLKLKARGADSVILGSWALEAGLILKQAKDVGFEPDVYACPSACDNPDLITAALGATDSVVVVASDSRTNTERQNALKQKFNETPTSVVLRFFDAMLMLSEADKGCAGGDRAGCLKTALAKVKNLPGSSYPIELDRNGDIVDRYQLKLIRDGKFVNARTEDRKLVAE